MKKIVAITITLVLLLSACAQATTTAEPVQEEPVITVEEVQEEIQEVEEPKIELTDLPTPETDTWGLDLKNQELIDYVALFADFYQLPRSDNQIEENHDDDITTFSYDVNDIIGIATYVNSDTGAMDSACFYASTADLTDDETALLLDYISLYFHVFAEKDSARSYMKSELLTDYFTNPLDETLTSSPIDITKDCIRTCVIYPELELTLVIDSGMLFITAVPYER